MGLLDIFRRLTKKSRRRGSALKEIWRGFQQILAGNNEILGLMENLSEALSGKKNPGPGDLVSQVELLQQRCAGQVAALQSMSGGAFPELESALLRIKEEVRGRLAAGPLDV